MAKMFRSKQNVRSLSQFRFFCRFVELSLLVIKQVELLPLVHYIDGLALFMC